MEHLTTIDMAVEQLIGLTEEVGTGIFMKQLDNGRQVFSCKCPVCGTIHGGFRTYGEAVANKKCSICHRNEIEKLKKDIEKVDEPRKQKNIFQNQLNKPVVIGEAEEDDLVKEMSYPLPERVAYEIFDGTEYYPLTDHGKIGRQGWNVNQMSGEWTVMGFSSGMKLSQATWSWKDMKDRLDRGELLVGYLFDMDHGTLRRWGRAVRVYKISVNEAEEEEDIKSILGGEPKIRGPWLNVGVVDKSVCLNAYHGQEFYHRTEKNADRVSPVRVRVSGRCKTWATRPNEFRLPVKYGLYQSFAITHWNADEWTTDPEGVEPPKLRPPRPRRRRADQGRAGQVEPPVPPVE